MLALALAAGCKQVTEIQNLFDNVGKLTCILGGSAKRKAILDHVNTASKENNDLAEQLLQTDDDMLNESDIAIKQGSHKKISANALCNSLDCKSKLIPCARQAIGHVLSHCSFMSVFIRFYEYFNHTFWTIIKGTYPRFNWT